MYSMLPIPVILFSGIRNDFQWNTNRNYCWLIVTSSHTLVQTYLSQKPEQLFLGVGHPARPDDPSATRLARTV